jgi:hypothetical protein
VARKFIQGRHAGRYLGTKRLTILVSATHVPQYLRCNFSYYCEALAEAVLPGEPWTYDARSKRSGVSLTTLFHRARGQCSKEQKAESQQLSHCIGRESPRNVSETNLPSYSLQAFQARPFPPSSLNRSGRRCDDYLHRSTLRLVCVKVYLVINEPHCRKPCFFLRSYFLTLFLIIILLKPLKPLLLYSLPLI